MDTAAGGPTLLLHQRYSQMRHDGMYCFPHSDSAAYSHHHLRSMADPTHAPLAHRWLPSSMQSTCSTPSHNLEHDDQNSSSDDVFRATCVQHENDALSPLSQSRHCSYLIHCDAATTTNLCAAPIRACRRNSCGAPDGRMTTTRYGTKAAPAEEATATTCSKINGKRSIR